IIGCDFHPSWQQIAWLDSETGESGERKLVHASGEAQQFYRQLAAPALIGMEATGNSQWFIELVEDLGHQIWIGDAAQIRASYVRKQKTDKRDAAHILKLMVEGRFPRLWTPDREQRDLRQLVLHRHKLVLIRSRVKNELQHLSLNKGMQRKRRLWSQAGQQLLRELPLKKWAACRREDLLGLLTMLDEQIGKLNGAVGNALFYGNMWAPASPPAIYRLDLKTRQVGLVSDSEGTRFPRISPDGNFLSAISDTNRILLFDLKAHTKTELTKIGALAPVWSRD